MITTDQEDKFIELRAKGYSFDKISKKLKISKPTLINLSKKFQDKIRNLSAIEHEATVEKFKYTNLRQLKILSKLIDKVEFEILERGFKDVPTERLFNLYFRYSEELISKTNSKINLSQESLLSADLFKSEKWEI